jgi:hypothetical protein
MVTEEDGIFGESDFNSAIFRSIPSFLVYTVLCRAKRHKNVSTVSNVYNMPKYRFYSISSVRAPHKILEWYSSIMKNLTEAILQICVLFGIPLWPIFHHDHLLLDTGKKSA